MLRYNLEQSGFKVDVAFDGEEALRAVQEDVPDLILLDWMLPLMSGIEVCRQLRRQTATANVPIIMLTARGEEGDRVRGLDAGADDYVPKPFEPAELTLRINAILRRTLATRGEAPEIVTFGPFSFNSARGELSREGATVRLTEAEVALLRILAQRPGEVVSREELAKRTGAGLERSVDVQVTRLRRKVEVDPRAPVFLQTVRGVGYRLAAD